MTKLVHFDWAIKNLLRNKANQPTFTAQGIKSAAKKLDILSLTDKERKAYERYEENTHYEASMHESHYGRGKLDGKLEGIIEVAKSMLDCGIAVELVMKSTGLTLEEIGRIKTP